ncbi:hypothetical protein BCR37DRAFT_389979 [Protomyces lactucae-debilis]|uniref:Guanine nucleotide-binding protein subunit gamma n=1 Tax=Protomyces lactucae-debilis TaxID=2754530 RepID=A0A1Y2EQM6_PROLT|nr:uncharacterized protein BCR37DRAFT_389979 [Protomyces lactucae-debilis]ORY73903.1 hypothetical protein BCR37DRAFT_389979 [Protomyces lactucae-debilis]
MSFSAPQLVVKITAETSPGKGGDGTAKRSRVPQIAVRRQQLFGSDAPVSSLAKYAISRDVRQPPPDLARLTSLQQQQQASPQHYPSAVAGPESEIEGLLQLRLRSVQRQVATLKEEFDRPCIATSEACRNLIDYTMSTRDTLVPSVWGKAPAEEREFMGSTTSPGCCSIS